MAFALTWMFRGWLLATAAVLGPATTASAQNIEKVDYSSIKRGAQIARSCVSNSLRDFLAIGRCYTDASLKIHNDFVRIGFNFEVFCTEALAEENIRNNAQMSEPYKQYFETNVKTDFDNLEDSKRKLYIDTKNLCVITEINCDIAQRLEKYWAGRLRR
jgi:hypothetical protein